MIKSFFDVFYTLRSLNCVWAKTIFENIYLGHHATFKFLYKFWLISNIAILNDFCRQTFIAQNPPPLWDSRQILEVLFFFVLLTRAMQVSENGLNKCAFIYTKSLLEIIYYFPQIRFTCPSATGKKSVNWFCIIPAIFYFSYVWATLRTSLCCNLIEFLPSAISSYCNICGLKLGLVRVYVSLFWDILSLLFCHFQFCYVGSDC